MLNPIETTGMGKPARAYGEKAWPDSLRGVFYDAERAARVCRRLRLQELADRPAQVA